MIPVFLLSFTFPDWRKAFVSGKSLLATPAGIICCATAVIWLVGVFHTLNPRLSAEAWIRTFLLAYFSVFIGQLLVRHAEIHRPVLKALSVVCVLAWVLSYAGLAVPEVLGLIHAKGWTPQPPDLGLKQFSAVAMLLVPVALLAGFRLGGTWKILGIINTFGLIGVLIGASSRSSTAGLFAMVALVGGVVFWVKGSRRQLALFGGTLALGIAAIAFWAQELHQVYWARTLQSHYVIPNWMIDLARQEIWKFTWEKALESPWIGHGINVVNYLPGAHELVPGMGLTRYISGHPHNWILEIFAETGGLGLTAIFILIATMFVTFVRQYKHTSEPAILATIAVNAGYWVSGLFNFSFWSVWWQMTYFMLFALTCALAASHRCGHSSETPTVSRKT